MRMKKLALSLAILLPLLTACGSNPALRVLDTTPRQAKAPDSIKVIAAQPQRPFETIATWTGSEQSSFDSTTISLRRRAVDEAARIGADAVILSTCVETGPPAALPVAEGEPRPRQLKIYSKHADAKMIVWR
jgi:hypothetical protein